MFSVPEAYMTWEVDHDVKTESSFFGSKSKYYLGRVILPWSKADENWGFKIFNRTPVFTPGRAKYRGIIRACCHDESNGCQPG